MPISLDSADDVANAQAFIAKRPPLPFYSDTKYALPFGFKPSVATLPTHRADRCVGQRPRTEVPPAAPTGRDRTRSAWSKPLKMGPPP